MFLEIQAVPTKRYRWGHEVLSSKVAGGEEFPGGWTRDYQWRSHTIL